MPITLSNAFKGRQYPGEVILLCVRWYLRYPLSYEHVAELVSERGIEVDASCIWRWVQAYAPELDKRCRSHLKPTNKSYRVDETYIKVKGEDNYLYRAVDPTGHTVDLESMKNRVLTRQPCAPAYRSRLSESSGTIGETVPPTRCSEPSYASGPEGGRPSWTIASAAASPSAC